MQNGCDGTCCPLCGREGSEGFFEDRHRSYCRCAHCALVFVPETYWLDPDEERATYDLHRNDVRDPGYRRFLSRLSIPLSQRLAPGRYGLDFGCGPGPALALLLEEQGHRVNLYDPYYFDDPAALDDCYDFICATEVVEHLRDPAGEFSRLFRMLKPGGRLAIMTKLVIDRQAFSRWHYIRDLTHICFYSRETFKYLAQRFKAGLEFVASDVVFLQKPLGTL